MNAFALINIPIIFFIFKKDSGLLKKTIFYITVGFILFVGITLLNITGIKSQISGIYNQYLFSQEALVKNMTIAQSIGIHLLKTVLLYPLFLIILFIAAFSGIKNKKLFYLSLIYLIVYLLTISVTARWASSVDIYLRYLFPIGLFLLALIASLNLKFIKIYWALAGVSIFYFLLTLYYLSIPTTYNLAYNWILSNLNQEGTAVVVNVQEIDLPKNKISYLYTKDEQCGVLCNNTKEQNLNSNLDFLVIDGKSKSQEVPINLDAYYVEWRKLPANSRKRLLKVFENGTPDDTGYNIDYGLGNYFRPDYLNVKNLGKNIYIYSNK